MRHVADRTAIAAGMIADCTNSAAGRNAAEDIAAARKVADRMAAAVEREGDWVQRGIAEPAGRNLVAAARELYHKETVAVNLEKLYGWWQQTRRLADVDRLVGVAVASDLQGRLEYDPSRKTRR